MRWIFALLVLFHFVSHAKASAPETPKKSKQTDETPLADPLLVLAADGVDVLPRCAQLARRAAVPAMAYGLELSHSSPEDARELTGDLRTDLLALGGLAEAETNAGAGDGRRSPALAFGMSALVPGLGQAYNKSWIRAAVAGALEVGLWTGYVVWRGQGLDGEEAYEAFAHRQWSPYRYGSWLNAYPGYEGAALDVESISDIDFMNPGGWTAEQQLRLNSFFDDLRAAERVSRYNNADGSGTGNTFSHVLPNHGEQQYYELIGKYFQYGPGWDDWCEGRDPNDASCFSIDGFEQREAFAEKTSLFFEYATDHADANTLLRRASRLTSLAVANHALAALDALLTARLHNRGLAIESGIALRQSADGSVSPVANLRLTF